MRAGGRRQVAARGKTPDTDAVRIDVPLLGAGPHRADGMLGVLERGRMVIARSKTVLEHESGHAQGIEPASHLAALVVVGQSSIAPSGTDYHGCPGRLIRRRKRTGQRWPVCGFMAYRCGGALRPEQFLRPQPAQRFGQNGAGVLAVVAAIAVDELVIVLGELQGRGHLLVGQGPITGWIIQIAGAILEKDTDRLAGGLTDRPAASAYWRRG